VLVDFRCRLLTPEFNSILETGHVAREFEQFGHRKPSTMTMDDLLKGMEEAGIETVVSPGRDMETKGGSKVPLEHIAEMQNKYPGKIIGFGGIDCLKGHQAVRDVERSAELGLKGIMIDSMLCEVLANDRRLYPIYARCQHLKMPIIITCAGMGDPRWAAVRPVADVATDFPELKIIVSHTWPYLMDAIHLSVYFPNFFFELSGYFTWPGCDQIVAALNRRLIADHMIFASAFPVSPSLKRVVDRFRQFYGSVRQEVMEKVLRGNAERILGLG